MQTPDIKGFPLKSGLKGNILLIYKHLKKYTNKYKLTGFNRWS